MCVYRNHVWCLMWMMLFFKCTLTVLSVGHLEEYENKLKVILNPYQNLKYVGFELFRESYQHNSMYSVDNQGIMTSMGR